MNAITVNVKKRVCSPPLLGQDARRLTGHDAGD
jgi:hypothetical protein